MFGAVLLRSESEASSQIENLTASARAIAEAELLGVQAKSNAEMIVANTAAIQAALNLFATVDTAAILAMHRALMAARGPRSEDDQIADDSDRDNDPDDADEAEGEANYASADLSLHISNGSAARIGDI